MANGRSNTRRTPVPPVDEIVKDALGDVQRVVEGQPRSANVIGPEDLDENAEMGTVIQTPDGVKSVLVSLDWLTEMESRLEKAERPIRVKVKDAVVNNKKRILLVGGTVASLAVAGYVVTHKDEVLEAVEHTTEKAAEKVEHGANDVKQDAREARTGKRTK